MSSSTSPRTEQSSILPTKVRPTDAKVIQRLPRYAARHREEVEKRDAHPSPQIWVLGNIAPFPSITSSSFPTVDDTQPQDIQQIAYGWRPTRENLFENLCTGEISRQFPFVRALGVPPPAPGFPTSTDLERSIVQLDAALEAWLSEYDEVFSRMEVDIEKAARQSNGLNNDGYSWCICELFRCLAPLGHIPLPTNLLSYDHRWDSHLVEQWFEFRTNDELHIEIQSTLTLSVDDAEAAYNPAASSSVASSSSEVSFVGQVIQRAWKLLMNQKHMMQHLALVKAAFRLSVCSRLVQPNSQLNFSLVGKKIKHQPRFFTSKNMSTPPVGTGGDTFILIPAVVSAEWPHFFVARGTVFG